MQVAVIGAAGKMGFWFAGYFVKKGFSVSTLDVRSVTVAGAKSAATLQECVRDADLVLVSVPVQKTAGLVAKCSRDMKKGSRLAEISSVKRKTLPALKKVRKDLQVLCLHPMFGPGANAGKKLKMLMVPVRDRQGEEDAARRLFSGMSINVIADAKTHDRSIAAVLGLTYFVNIAFAGVMAREDLQALKKVGGTTFAVQSTLAESVMTDEPELASALICDNPYAHSFMAGYLKIAQQISGTKKLKPALKNIKQDLQKQADLQESYRRLYGMLKDRNNT